MYMFLLWFNNFDIHVHILSVHYVDYQSESQKFGHGLVQCVMNKPDTLYCKFFVQGRKITVTKQHVHGSICF